MDSNLEAKAEEHQATEVAIEAEAKVEDQGIIKAIT